MAAPLQSDQQLFDFVELDIIAREARDVMCKGIAWRPNIGHVVFLGHLPDADGGCAFGSFEHKIQYSISSGENPLRR